MQSYLRKYKLLELALSCSLSLLLTLYAGLLIVLSLTKLGQNAGLNTLSLETTKCVVESLVFFNSDFCHLYFPSLRHSRLDISVFHSVLATVGVL